jgi:photosystem II stability/assembly factor-like uncharacterized protein
MKIDKRLALTLLASLVAPLLLSCNSAQKNSNQQSDDRPATPAKAGRWVAQYRSPVSAKYAAGNLAVIFYSSISVVSKDVVFVAGDMPDEKGHSDTVGVIVSTTDGGQNWKETYIEQPGLIVTHLNSISFVSPELGWAVGTDSALGGILLKTTDGGATWAVSRLSAKQLPTTVCFADADTGWMGGATPPPGEDEGEGGPSAILGTTDGGRTWVSQINLPVTIFDLSFVDKTTGWAAGSKGAIYHTTDGGRTWNAQRSELEPNPGMGDLNIEGVKQFRVLGINFPDREHGYAVTSAEEEDRGLLLGTSNGGDTWARLWITADSGIRDTHFVSANEGWAVTDQGKYIYHTVDGGHSWLSEPRVFEQDVTLVRLGGADAAHVWAVGGGAIFTRTE